MRLNLIPTSIVKILIRKIRNAPSRSSQKIASFYSLFVSIFIALLTDKYWLIDHFPKKKNGHSSLMLVRLDLIGDFIIWLDAAKEFKKLYPDKHIVLYANSVWASLAECLPYWDEIVPVDVTRLRSDDFYRFKLLCGVHRSGFDTAIQPTFSREYVADLVIRASKAPHRIGHFGDTNNISAENKSITDTWYTKLISNDVFPLVELNLNAELIRALGYKDFKSQLPNLKKLAEVPAEFKIGTNYCVIVPGASWSPKMWPLVNFAELASKIKQRRNLEIVLCGIKSERMICDQVAELSGVETINLSGQTSLVQMIEIIRHAALLIANDSASAHIAAATQTPCVCIVGGGHFGRFLPYQPETKEKLHTLPIAAYYEMKCYGCFWRCDYILGTNDVVPCILGVGVEQVLDACNLLFENWKLDQQRAVDLI